MVKKMFALIILIFACLYIYIYFNENNNTVVSTNNISTEQNNIDPDVLEEPKDKISEIIDDMTLQEKICQMMIVAPETLIHTQDSSTSGDKLKTALTEYPISGLIYFANNL